METCETYRAWCLQDCPAGSSGAGASHRVPGRGSWCLVQVGFLARQNRNLYFTQTIILNEVQNLIHKLINYTGLIAKGPICWHIDSPFKPKVCNWNNFPSSKGRTRNWLLFKSSSLRKTIEWITKYPQMHSSWFTRWTRRVISISSWQQQHLYNSYTTCKCFNSRPQPFNWSNWIFSSSQKIYL